MKKITFGLILPLVVVSGLVLANRAIKKETAKKAIPKALSAAEKKAALKRWEATPDGIMFTNWKASPGGRKVHDSAAKIMKSVHDFSNMEAVVTSLSLPAGSRLGFGMMLNIDGADYILSFGLENKNEFEPLHTLKVNDKIILKSHNISQAPKYAYPIVAGDCVEKDGKIIYKRAPRKGGC